MRLLRLWLFLFVWITFQGTLTAQHAVMPNPTLPLADSVGAFASPEELPGYRFADPSIVDTVRALLRSRTAWQPAGPDPLEPRGQYRRIYTITVLAADTSNRVLGTLRLGAKALELEVGGHRYWHALDRDVERRLLLLIGYARGAVASGG